VATPNFTVVNANLCSKTNYRNLCLLYVHFQDFVVLQKEFAIARQDSAPYIDGGGVSSAPPGHIVGGRGRAAPRQQPHHLA